MKKGKLKKILASSAMGIMALAMPFALTGCDKDSDINVRVEGEYVQWQVEGEDSWTNLLTIDEIKDLLGESYKGDTGAKGEQGNPGINGKEVEFRNNGEFIQWRYVDSNQNQDDNWENLIEVTSLKGNPGQSGSKGDDGLTPYIGDNGNWWIGDKDTEIKAEAQDGNSPTIEISEAGYWIINGEETEYKAIGIDGSKGNGIKSINIDQDNSNKTKTVYIITFDDNTTYSFEVLNGTDGNDGETPYIGKNGNWWIGQTDTHVIAQVKVNFDYNNPAFLENLGINVYEFANEKKTQQKITLSAWLDSLMPNFNNTEFEEYFQGWFIEGTNKEITRYDLIGGNITLKAKWNETNIEKYYNKGATFTYKNSSYTAYLLSDQDRIVIPQYYNDNINGEHPVKIVNKSDIANYSQSTLTYLSLSNSIERIGEKAFYNCEKLQSIKIPNSITQIGKDAFYMNNIRNIYVDNLNVWINIEFADKESNPMYAPYVYGEGFKTTGADLYVNNTKLTELVLGANYDEVKSYAFCDLQVEMISVNCSKINDYAFKGCSAPLIIFNDSVAEIGDLDTSRVCDSIKFGQGITSINENALSECLGFAKITISSQAVLDTITSNFKIAGCSLSQTTTIHIKNDLDITSLVGLTNYFEKTGTYGDCDVWARK